MIKTTPHIDINFTTFSGGERHIQLNNLPPIAHDETIIVEVSLDNSEDILDLLLFDNTLSKFMVNYNLFIDYLPYARQDRVCSVGQAFSLEVMADILNILTYTDIFVCDVHSDVAGTLIRNFHNISPEKLLDKSVFLSSRLENDSDIILICPDKGAIYRCTDIKEYFGINDMIVCDKIRDPSTGQITETVVNHTGDLPNTHCFIMDDICDGGRTFVEIAKVLREKKVPEISLYVTHGIFSKGFSVFGNLIDTVYYHKEGNIHQVNIGKI